MSAVTRAVARRTGPVLTVGATVVGLWLGLQAPSVSPVDAAVTPLPPAAVTEAPVPLPDVVGDDPFDDDDGPRGRDGQRG